MNDNDISKRLSAELEASLSTAQLPVCLPRDLTMTARHKWGEAKFSGSMVCHKWAARCTRCDATRERHFDFGQYRTVYLDASPYGGASAKASACTPTKPPQRKDFES